MKKKSNILNSRKRKKVVAVIKKWQPQSFMHKDLDSKKISMAGGALVAADLVLTGGGISLLYTSSLLIAGGFGTVLDKTRSSYKNKMGQRIQASPIEIKTVKRAEAKLYKLFNSLSKRKTVESRVVSEMRSVRNDIETMMTVCKVDGKKNARFRVDLNILSKI